jgi:transposase
MSKVPKKRSPEFKFNVVLEVLKGDQTITQIASKYDLHPKQIQRWRDHFLSEAKDIFVHKSTQKSADPDKKDLLRVIDQLTLELDFIKKKLGKLS